MATAKELLAALTNSGDDGTLVIDNNLRTIHIPKSVALLGVESDDEVHRLQFTMPRYCGDVDLSTFNIRINYMNAKKEGDIYVVTDKNVLLSSITFSWLVGRNALAYKGDVRFIVCLKDSNADGEVLREFNTTVASLPVLEGLEVDPSYLEGELSDVLEQLQSLTVAKVNEVITEGTTQIEKVQAESTKQQDNIVEKGAQVLATIPEEYQTTVKLANEGVRTKADAITRSAEGELIQLSDASDDNLRGLKLFGKTTQKTTTGKNLFGGDALADKLAEEVRAIKDEENGTVTFYGSNSADKVLFTDFKPNTQYTFFLYGKNSTIARSNIIILYTDGTLDNTNFSAVDTNEFVIVHSNAGKTIEKFLGYNSGGTTILEYDKCGIFEGVLTEADFEPYTGGIPAPNPDYPQELVSVGNGGTINTTVVGKNLIPNQYRTGYAVGQNSAGVLVYKSDGRSAVADILLQPGTYTLSGTDKAYVFLHTKEREPKRYVNSAATPYTFTISDSESTYFSFHCATTHEGKCQLERGSVATDFEPYIGSTITAQTPNGLPGVPVTSGGNYTDESGQQWVCDEIDYERQVYVQRINTYSVIGTETINQGSAAWQKDGMYSFYISISATYGVDTADAVSNCLSTHATPNSWEWKSSNKLNNVGVRKNMIYLSFNNDTLGILSDDTDETKLEKAQVYIAGQYTNGTPVIVKYPIATSIETPLSADDLATYAAAKTVKPKTTIYNDANVQMEVEYNLDTEIAVDNKIDVASKETAKLCAPVITSEESGNIISVSDASDWYASGLTLYGKTTQFTTTGKNLLNTDELAYDTSIVVNGNTITITPLSTGQAVVPRHTLGEVLMANAGDTVTITGQTTGTSRLYIVDTATSWLWGTSLTLTAEMLASSFYLYGGTTNGTPATITNLMIRLTSVTDDTYEPYTGGIPAPNPEYPQELVTVGESGAINTTVVGKNLFGGDALADKLVECGATKDAENGTVRLLGSQAHQQVLFDSFKENTQYTFIFDVIVNGTGTPLNVEIAYTDRTYKRCYVSTAGTRETIAVVSDSGKTIASLRGVNTTNTTYYYDNCGIFEGVLIKADFEPYTAQTLTASTPNGLPGIPVTTGGNYTDENGQQWIADEVDFARGVYVKQIAAVDMGTFNWAINTNSSGTKCFQSTTKIRNRYGTGRNIMRCTSYSVRDNRNALTTDKTIAPYNSNGTAYVWARDDDYTDIESFKASLSGVILLYVMETPIETPLSAQELAAYAELHTNKPNTTVYNDSGAGMKLAYAADTKTYINNMIASAVAALAQATEQY